MRVCHFEDRLVADLEPLTLTRPAFDLLCGQSSLAEKQQRYFSAASLGVLIRPHLAKCWQARQPGVAVNDEEWLRAGPAVLVNARWLPPAGTVTLPASPCVSMAGGEVAYAVLEPQQLAGCSPRTIDECLETWKTTLPRREAGGRHFQFLWEVVERNGEQIIADSAGARPENVERPAPMPAIVGPGDLLSIHPTARVEPMVVIDTTGGPVVIARDAVVMAFTRLEGPCYVGPRTQVHGARVRGGSTFGPDCRIGGEVEASIVQGASNKYHDGFLGHAYVGEWVNLAAGTHNSDLRNDYGPVAVTVNGRSVPTGRTKVGCFLGDHVKTGLGALLNTGMNAGIFCNLLPGTLLPKYVPSFASWWNGALSDRADLWNLLQTAAHMMGRRGCTLTEAHAEMYRAVFEQTVVERARALRAAEMRRLRRSA